MVQISNYGDTPFCNGIKAEEIEIRKIVKLLLGIFEKALHGHGSQNHKSTCNFVQVYIPTPQT